MLARGDTIPHPSLKMATVIPSHIGNTFLRTYGTTQIPRFRHGWLLLRMCLFALRRIKFV